MATDIRNVPAALDEDLKVREYISKLADLRSTGVTRVNDLKQQIIATKKSRMLAAMTEKAVSPMATYWLIFRSFMDLHLPERETAVRQRAPPSRRRAQRHTAPAQRGCDGNRESAYQSSESGGQHALNQDLLS